METHDDWKPLLTTFEEVYASKAGADKAFVEFCEGKGINPEEPKAPNVFGFDWSGDVLLEGDWKVFAKEMGVEAEEGMHLVGGRAIHPCKTHHPNEWPEWRIYLEAELAASAATAAGQPFWMDHAIPLAGKNKILAARYFDGELQYVGQVEEYLKNMIERKEIKHISPGFEWTVLEKLNGIAPRGIRYYEFSLLKNLRPGDTTTTVELWEALIGHCTEGVKQPYKAAELNQFIESELLEKRIMIFHGQVGEDICREASKRLEYMATVNKDPIKVILNSVGGDVFDGLLVFDTIKNLTNSGIDVMCEARGLAASMGSIILQAGTRRTATPHTRFLIHEVSSWAWGKASSIEEEAEEINKVNMLLKEILAERTGKTTDEIEAIWRKKDVWMSALEAEEFGLIDEIVSGMVEGSRLKEMFDQVFKCPACGVSATGEELGAGMPSGVTQFKCPICGHVGPDMSWILEGSLQEKAFGDYDSVEDCISKNQDKEDPAAYCAEACRQTEALCEALGITMADFAALGWEGRFAAVADFFEEQVYVSTIKPLINVGMQEVIKCPNCNFRAEYVQFYQNGNKCPSCLAKLSYDAQVEVVGHSILGEATAAQAREHHGLSQEEWDVLTEEEKAAKIASTPDASEGLVEATAAQAREHHGISQEDWDALSEEEKAAKIASVPAAEEGKLRKTALRLFEQIMMPAADAVMSGLFIRCPNCTKKNYSHDFSGGICPNCGWELTVDELVEVYTDLWEGAKKEIILLRLKLGEAALAPTTGMSLEIPGYISASLVEAIIPKQMHHKAQPGHQRIVRQLRGLVKRAREVN